MNDFVRGAVAGLAATAPMTLAMSAMHRALPPEERYPLPPKRITMRLADEAGFKDELGERERNALTMLAHFDYGAAMGGLYGLLEPRLPGPPAAKGVGFGLAVWTVSYLGLLPLAGILKPATEHPPRRSALMIAAHVVWGASLGVGYARLR